MNRMMILITGACLSLQAWAMPDEKAVLTHYADLAQAMYQDSLTTAQALQKAIDQFIEQPTQSNLDATRSAWKAARVPYQQTEVYRFGNAIVDDWEGKVNAWPLDEGLIDYVAASYGHSSDENPLYTANVIANPKLKLGSKTIDASIIDKQFLAETLHEADGVETNVATGYHAIEFLLWGQDLNGTGPGAGNRPATDYDPAKCSNGNCQRRAAYLKAAAELLVDDLRWIVTQWGTKGDARQALFAGSLAQGLGAIFTGIGSLSYGELAGERMQLGLMLHDPEEEHDCFSDNTHNSHYYDSLGINSVYTGTYTRIDGSKLNGPSIADLVANKNAAVDKEIRQNLANMLDKMQVLVINAEQKGMAYDQMIATGNTEGNAQVQAAIDSLVALAKSTEKGVTTLNLGSIAFEGSDSLDAPSRVFE